MSNDDLNSRCYHSLMQSNDHNHHQLPTPHNNSHVQRNTWQSLLSFHNVHYHKWQSTDGTEPIREGERPVLLGFNTPATFSRIKWTSLYLNQRKLRQMFFSTCIFVLVMCRTSLESPLDCIERIPVEFVDFHLPKGKWNSNDEHQAKNSSGKVLKVVFMIWFHFETEIEFEENFPNLRGKQEIPLN